MANATVVIEGKEHTVETSAITLQDGHKILDTSEYLARSAVEEHYVPKASVESTIKDRFKGWVKKDEAWNDDFIVSKVLEKHGKEKVDLESVKKSWAEEELAPVSKRAESLESRARAALINDAARAAGVAEQHTKPIKPGAPSYMEVVYGSSFKYDSDLGDFVAVTRDGQPLGALNPTHDRQFMSAEEFFSREVKSDGMKPFLAPPPKNDKGPKIGDADPNATSGSTKSFSEKTPEQRRAEYVKRYQEKHKEG